ncbi:hypothetical protein N8T08_004696 [Aspergillus melleus]|uniref:Uncharacterized protein n=1 Tax=Aspergillus melleus TaxID=138277 RepID=A0ACC3B3L1_9EURO|nr:hypothetical protein N8T08_004696 [Aspergillus melleus]
MVPAEHIAGVLPEQAEWLVGVKNSLLSQPQTIGPKTRTSFLFCWLLRSVNDASLLNQDYKLESYVCLSARSFHLLADVDAKPSSSQSRLLVTNVLDQESILLCEAEIATDLLNALGNLKTAVMPLTWPTIHRKMIPYKPYDAFVGRLMGQLVAPSPSDSPPQHVNHSTSSETNRRHGRGDEDEDSGPRKIRRISGS